MASPRQAYLARVFLLTACLLATAHAANFDQCKEKVEGILNGTVENRSTFDILYYGDVRGLSSTKAEGPTTLTFDGCEEACGSSVDPNDAYKAFSIFTTWALPAVALLSQLPWESATKKRINVEALINWIGGPASALTHTMFNILVIRRAGKLAREKGGSLVIDAYYVLSCINQYEYPYTSDPNETMRDKALVHGILGPLYPRYGTSDDNMRSQALLINLAFHLRLQRRKAVYTLLINVLWFLLAFVISIVIAFVNLGDNSTAHSLALGLLISWIPVLVVMAIIDRNPVNARRCKVLVERWLHNNAWIIDSEGVQDSLRGAPHVNGSASTPSTGQPNTSSGTGQGATTANGSLPNEQVPSNTNQRSRSQCWEKHDPEIFQIGDFVGQGRRLRYCGIANAVFDLEQSMKKKPNTAPHDLVEESLKNDVERRPGVWYLIWLWSFVIFSTAFGMAFMVSFKTPTIGLGCRSLMYLIFYLLSITSWFLQLVPVVYHSKVRYITWVFNFFATLAVFLIMMLQVTNGLNNCKCKSSIFGQRSYGRYMDFEDANYYRENFGVTTIWAIATAVGFVNSILPILWASVRWQGSKELWRVRETEQPEQEGFELYLRSLT